MYRADRFTAVLDANVLFGALKRLTVLTLAETGFYRARFSSTILDEFERNLADKKGCKERASHHRNGIEQNFEECIVEDFEPLMDRLELPDPSDNHVLACAIKTKASVIVTDNVKDFPNNQLKAWEIEARDADTFVADVLDLQPNRTIPPLGEMRMHFKNPETTAEKLILRYEQIGMVQTAEILSEHIELL